MSYLVYIYFKVDVPEGITITWQQYVTKSTVQYRLRLMQNQDEIQGQKVFIANDLTKQNISVSDLYVSHVCRTLSTIIVMIIMYLCFQLYIRMSRYSHFIPLSGIQWVDYMYFHRYTLGTFAVVAITIFYSK